jgi:hypothetical protein
MPIFARAVGEQEVAQAAVRQVFQTAKTSLWRNFVPFRLFGLHCSTQQEAIMHGIIYLVGLIVIVLAILSLFGLR